MSEKAHDINDSDYLMSSSIDELIDLAGKSPVVSELARRLRLREKTLPKVTHTFHLPGYTDRIPPILAKVFAETDNIEELVEDYYDMKMTDRIREITQELINKGKSEYDDICGDDYVYVSEKTRMDPMQYFPLIDALYQESQYMGDKTDSCTSYFNDVLGNRVTIDPDIHRALFKYQPNPYYGGILIEGNVCVSLSTWKDLDFCYMCGISGFDTVLYGDNKAIVVVDYDSESG